MIYFSTLKELYLDGKKVTSLFLDGHEVPFGEEPSKYFTVTALDQQTTMTIVIGGGSPSAFSLEYSTDGNMWSSYSAAQTITLDAGTSVMFRRVGEATTTFSSGTSNYWKFSFSANAKVSGNIMSLLDASMQSTTVGANAFCRLFFRNDRLVDISELELPATTLADYCYREMFAYCTSLSAVPTLLPATTLASGCYMNMFNQCRSLTNAPALPATTLASGCYAAMFGNCSSLTAAPALPATTLAEYCYQQMFYRCSSLAAAPALPATTLASNCYTQIFHNCTSLDSISASFTEWPSGGCTNWAYNTASTGTLYCPAALGTNDTITRGTNYCPNGWTVVNYDAT